MSVQNEILDSIKSKTFQTNQTPKLLQFIRESKEKNNGGLPEHIETEIKNHFLSELNLDSAKITQTVSILFHLLQNFNFDSINEVLNRVFSLVEDCHNSNLITTVCTGLVYFLDSDSIKLPIGIIEEIFLFLSQKLKNDPQNDDELKSIYFALRNLFQVIENQSKPEEFIKLFHSKLEMTFRYLIQSKNFKKRSVTENYLSHTIDRHLESPLSFAFSSEFITELLNEPVTIQYGLTLSSKLFAKLNLLQGHKDTAENEEIISNLIQRIAFIYENNFTVQHELTKTQRGTDLKKLSLDALRELSRNCPMDRFLDLIPLINNKGSSGKIDFNRAWVLKLIRFSPGGASEKLLSFVERVLPLAKTALCDPPSLVVGAINEENTAEIDQISKIKNFGLTVLETLSAICSKSNHFDNQSDLKTVFNAVKNNFEFFEFQIKNENASKEIKNSIRNLFEALLNNKTDSPEVQTEATFYMETFFNLLKSKGPQKRTNLVETMKPICRVIEEQKIILSVENLLLIDEKDSKNDFLSVLDVLVIFLSRFFHSIPFSTKILHFLLNKLKTSKKNTKKKLLFALKEFGRNNAHLIKENKKEICETLVKHKVPNSAMRAKLKCFRLVLELETAEMKSEFSIEFAKSILPIVTSSLKIINHKTHAEAIDLLRLIESSFGIKVPKEKKVEKVVRKRHNWKKTKRVGRRNK